MSKNSSKQFDHHHKKPKVATFSRRPTWFLGRRTAITIAVLLVSGLAIGEMYLQLAGPKSLSVPGWIIEGDQLQGLVAYLPSSLAKTYFDTKTTVALKNFTANGGNPVPGGWLSQPGNHYTSFTAQGCRSGCASLQRDLTSNKTNTTPKPVALYDDEHWARTPVAEQTHPCAAMASFVQAAQKAGLTTILAPDQNLAQPGVITAYQGGESENWQTYLRLGLATCAAKTGAPWYHIMSQPFEAHWCGNPLNSCQSSEADFVNFVTQAALQARAVNPRITISDGLSTNPLYFGYFRGAETLAKILYRDYADVQHSVNAVWLNVVGRNANTTALYFLSELGKNSQATRRSSVLFLQANQSLQNTQPNNNQSDAFSLDHRGSTMSFITTQALQGGTGLPAGTGEFQFWTDGISGQRAKLGVKFGYCSNTNCSNRTIIKSLSFWMHGDARGATVADGAFTTRSSLTLPRQGQYHLFVELITESAAPFSLRYGSSNAATNLATPVLLPRK